MHFGHTRSYIQQQFVGHRCLSYKSLGGNEASVRVLFRAFDRSGNL